MVYGVCLIAKIYDKFYRDSLLILNYAIIWGHFSRILTGHSRSFSGAVLHSIFGGFSETFGGITCISRAFMFRDVCYCCIAPSIFSASLSLCSCLSRLCSAFPSSMGLLLCLIFISTFSDRLDTWLVFSFL